MTIVTETLIIYNYDDNSTYNKRLKQFLPTVFGPSW
jgi:hypothetical protein